MAEPKLPKGSHEGQVLEAQGGKLYQWVNGKWVPYNASAASATPAPSALPRPTTPGVGGGSSAGGDSPPPKSPKQPKTPKPSEIDWDKWYQKEFEAIIPTLPHSGDPENPLIGDTYEGAKFSDLSPIEQKKVFEYRDERRANPNFTDEQIWQGIDLAHQGEQDEAYKEWLRSKGIEVVDTPPADDTNLDFDGTGATGPTPQELQLAQASQVANLLAEKSSRQQASLQAVTDVMDAFVKSLKTSVTPELRAEIAESAWMKPEELPAVQNIDYSPMMEQAKAINTPIEQDVPEMQRALKMMLQPQMKGGALVRAQGGVNYMPQTGSWNPNPYALFAQQGGQVSNIQPGQEWIDPLQTYHQQTNPAWQRDIQEQTGYVVPGLTGALSREWGTGYESAIREGRALPTLERQKLEEGRRQFDVGEANALEIEEIRSSADRDVANIQAQGQARAASIMAAADRAAAEAQLQGDLAQADAIRYQADQAARAEIESANIDAQARRDVASMQEEGANKRMGAQLGMQWAETSQQMAANPRDFLKLAFRQAGVGVPESLSSFMQPNGGATPNMAGAPAGIQQALAQMLGGG